MLLPLQVKTPEFDTSKDHNELQINLQQYSILDSSGFWFLDFQ